MALPIYNDIPELSAEAQAIARRQKIAEAMMARGQQPIDSVQMAGQVVAPVSWTQGAAQMLNSYLGAKGLKDAENEYGGLADKRQKMVEAAMEKFRTTSQGTPAVEGIEAQPERTIQAPAPMQEGQVAPNFNGVRETVPAVAGRAAVPAVAGNTRQAIIDAAMSNLPEMQNLAKTAQMYETLDQNQKFKSEEAEAARVASAEQRALDREMKVENLKEQIRSREMMGQQSNDLKAAMANLMAESRMDIARMNNATRTDIADARNAAKTALTPNQQMKLDKQKSQDASTVGQTEQTIDEIKRSIADIRGSKGLSKRTGLSGYLPAQVQGEEARKAENRINTLKGKVTQMGKTMATLSGAIGPMAVQEWKIVSDAVTAIDPTAGNFEEQLQNIERQAEGALTRVKDKYEMQYDDAPMTKSSGGGSVDDRLKKYK